MQTALTLKDKRAGRELRESLVAFFVKSRQHEAWPEDKASEDPQFVLAIPLLVIAGSNSPGERDVDQLVQLLKISPIFRGYPEDELQSLIHDCVQAKSEMNVEQTCANVSKSLSLPLRETALSLAMQVVLVDGSYDEIEHDKLFEIAMALGIESDRFLHMFEVLVILHRTLD